MEVNLLPWKPPWKSVESDYFHLNFHEVGGCRFTFMEVSGSFHGSTWKFPLSEEVEASVASINCSVHEHSPWKLPYTPTYFHLLPRLSQTSSCFYKTSIRDHRLPFDLLPWWFPPTSMEVNLLPWKLLQVDLLAWKLVEVDLLPWILVEASMEAHGSLHCRWK